MENNDTQRQEQFVYELKLLCEKYNYSIDDILTLNVVISQKHDKPAVFLRRNTTDPEIIKRLIQSAYHRVPLIIMPQFTNALQSLNTAIEKGILYRDQMQNKYIFNI